MSEWQPPLPPKPRRLMPPGFFDVSGWRDWHVEYGGTEEEFWRELRRGGVVGLTITAAILLGIAALLHW